MTYETALDSVVLEIASRSAERWAGTLSLLADAEKRERD